MSIYVPSAFKITGSSATQLNGVHDVAADPAIQIVEQFAAGQIEPSHQAVMAQLPMIEFSTYELATALGAIGIGGLKIPNSTVITGWEQYYAQLDNAGDRVSGSNHAKLSGVSGMIVCSEITARQNQYAVAKFGVHLTYDGTNAPWTAATGVSLLSSIALNESFTVGPVSLNGTLYSAELIQGITVSTGIQIIKRAGSGEVFPRRVHVMQRRPVIRIESDRWTDFTTYGISGTAQSSTASKVWFRKLDRDGTRVADGTAEHVLVTVTASQGIICPQAKRSGNANDIAAGEVMIYPRGGASTSTTINTASAIS